MTPRAGVAAAPRLATPGRPAPAWSLPFAPASTVGTEDGDVFDQLADPPGPAGARRRGLRVWAPPGADLALFALLDGWLSVQRGNPGDPPVLLLTVDRPKAVDNWPAGALAGPPAFVAYTGIDPDEARAMLSAMIADGFAEPTRRMPLTPIGKGKGKPLSVELDQRYRRAAIGAPAAVRTPAERRQWVVDQLPGLLDELTFGVWVAAGEGVGLASAPAEVLVFDKEGLPIDPRGCFGRLKVTAGLATLTEVPGERAAALGLSGPLLPLLATDPDGNVRLPADAGTAALRHGHDSFRPVVQGAPSEQQLVLAPSLRITTTPAPMPASIAEGWSITRAPGPGEGGLLVEAMRCFVHSDGAVTHTKTWPSLADRTADAELDKLRLHLHDRTAALLAGLVETLKKPNKVVREFNPGEFSARGGSVPVHLRGRFAVRALIAPQWRDPRAGAELRNRARSGRLSLRRFEDLAPALAELRALAARPRVESALAAAFGPAIVAPWGGTGAIARPGRESGTGGFAALNRDDVGLTEKLYEELATTPFRPIRDIPKVPRREIAATQPGAAPFRLHLEIAAQADTVLREILPDGALPADWRALLAAVDTVEGRFLQACEADRSLAAATGLPFGVALAAVLRAYLVELVGRLLTLALPIDFAYHRIDGYLGVALAEAFTGSLAPTAQGPDGYLTTVAGDPLLTTLSGWRVDDFTAAWPMAGVPHQDVAARLTEMAERPFPLVDEMRPEGSAVRHGTQEGLLARQTVFPAYRTPGPELKDLAPYLHARLSAQGRLFVAAEIVRIAIVELRMPATVARNKTDAGAAGRLIVPAALPAPEPIAGGLGMGAGSYAWGGQHPPHSTHRDGETFDVSFGPNSLPWQAADKDLEGLLAPLKRNNPNFTELQMTSLATAPGDGTRAGPLVFRGMVAAVVRQQFALLRPLLGDGPVTPEERAVCARIESALSGTPHFFFSRSAQQVQTSIVAVLLAGASQVISGSPIAHLRAIRAIREGLTATDADLRGTVSTLLKEGKPVFMAHNHHNHLHVQFAKSGDPREATTAERDAELFARDLDLWIRLGIDLRPLLAHYEGLVLDQDDPRLVQVQEERQLLIDALRARSAELAPTPAARQRLWGILATLSSQGSLVAPAQAAGFSDALRQIPIETEEVVRPVLRGRNRRQSFEVGTEESGEDQD